MKYLRKIVALVISVVMLAAVIIGVCVIFAVRNVNVTLLSYSCSSDSEEALQKSAQFKTSVLTKVRGTVISFVDEEDIASAIGGGDYVLEGCEKVYPCTINVTVRERCEVFAEQTADGTYRIYDEDGVYLRTDETCLGKVDGAPNVILEGAESAEDIKSIAALSKIFKSKFSSLRSVAETVELQKAKSRLETDKVIFKLRCGVSVEIQDFTNKAEEKLNAGHGQFAKLSGEQKLGGKIYCYSTAEDQVSATYNPKA